MNIVAGATSGDTGGTGSTLDLSSTYSSGDTSITVTLTAAVLLDADATHTPLLVEANTGVVAPYVTADLATFYEACFVQTNIAPALITVATTLLDITAAVQISVIPTQVCLSK